LALGEYNGGWSTEARGQLESELLTIFRNDLDPGIHSAAEWLLRRWGKADSIRRIIDELAGLEPRAGFGWFVSKQRHTFSIVTGPVVFKSGSPSHELGRFWNEPPHPKRINRSFAIATNEVTMVQFERFVREHPEISILTEKRYSPEPDCPVNTVSWYAATAYCRWLSEQEGFHETQMCYPPITEIKEGMELPANLLDRTGYRLPTAAEWEFACRAGAETVRPYGEDPAMIPHYSWYSANSGDRTQPVGRLKPNDLGLFDILGNVVEWCQDPGVLCEPGPRGWAFEDRPILTPVLNKTMRILRGGAYDDQPENLRSAKRNGFLPTYRFTYNGLRLARTVP